MRPNFIECCSKKIKPTRTINLEPIDGYIDRALIVGYCPICKNIKYQLIEFDLYKGQYILNRNKPKRLKHINEWAEKLERQESTNPIVDGKIKHGSKSAMAFIFGKSKETPLGTLHKGYDFNGTERKQFLTGVGIAN